MSSERKKAASACIECRVRKRKCSFDGASTKCTICERLGLQCVTKSDGRKERPQNRRILDLENQLRQYRQVTQGLRESLDMASETLRQLERSEGVAGPADTEAGETSSDAFIDHSMASPRSTVVTPVFPKNRPPSYFQPTAFQNTPNVAVSVYGPTSIFDSESLPKRQLRPEHRRASLCKNSRVVECIQLFFRWQYPDMHAFIFREAFLLDFFDPDSKGVYSSTELVYAICAVGASMAEDSDLRGQADTYYEMARDMLKASINEPSVCSLQAYLLLGLYDIYNHRHNAGWMLTGGALRLGFGIGFHLRPESWHLGDKSQVSDLTISVRSRIFWGCFMADRFVSLILGRPSVIRPDSATIHVAANMPAIEWIQPYTYPGIDDEGKPQYIDISNPIGSIVQLAQISDEMMALVFSDSETVSRADKLALVEDFNRKISVWRADLPEDLQWNRVTLAEKGHDITRMFTRYYFYIVLLCLNRPFVGVPYKNQNPAYNSWNICLDALWDVHAAIFSFIQAHGARRCSILIVYSSIISISILLAKIKKFKIKEETALFFEFMKVLRYSSATWRISEISFARFRAKLKSQFGLDYDTELARHFDSDPFLYGNSIVKLLSFRGKEEESDLPNVENFDANALGGSEFATFGDVNAWSSFFPDFFTE